jgi:hypothetical protein
MHELMLLDGSCYYAGISATVIGFMIWLHFWMIQSHFVSLVGSDHLLILLARGCSLEVNCTFSGAIIVIVFFSELRIEKEF